MPVFLFNSPSIPTCALQGDSDAYDFGKGAGFYLNATEDKWAANYKMYDYVTKELPALVSSLFATTGKQSIMG